MECDQGFLIRTRSSLVMLIVGIPSSSTSGAESWCSKISETSSTWAVVVPTDRSASLKEGGVVPFSVSMSFILRLCLSNRSASSFVVSVRAAAGVLLASDSLGGWSLSGCFSRSFVCIFFHFPFPSIRVPSSPRQTAGRAFWRR